MAMRFALERQKRFLKTSRFALGDGNSEVLTSWENSLGDRGDVHSEDGRSDSEEETATLQSQFVEAAHFSDGFQEKSRQEVIQNLIARSKVAKAENKVRREEAIAHVELADEMFTSLLQRHKFNCIVSEQKDVQEKGVAKNSYDLVLGELVAGGSWSRPSSGRHDPNELAKAKKEELIRLEQLRRKNSATTSSDELATVPYLLEMPDNYEHFCDLLAGHSPAVQCTILSRLITCHHVSFRYENRRLLGKLMLFAIRYFQTMACLKCAITLATASLELYADLPCITEISILLQAAVEMLPAEHLVGILGKVVNCFKAVVTTISSVRGTLKPLALECTVKQFKTLEPKIEADFDPERRRKTKDEEEQRKILSRKYKREFRGAVRELKRDNEFLARHRLNEIMQRDAYRKEKTNQIMRDLVQQEAEHKKLKRVKGPKH
ncbi:hypothetical protein D918_07489 [Trichuris suis]|nr:hypothetical protein D918_07489 [Trichuris suis]